MAQINFFRCINAKIKNTFDFIRERYILFCLDFSESERGPGTDLRKFMLNHILKKGKKKLICIYGECHATVYSELLLKSKSFRKKYLMLGGKGIIYFMCKHPRYIRKKEMWEKVDIFLYTIMPVRGNAPQVSEILEWIPECTLKIKVTNAFFKGYMPQHTNNVFPNKGYFIWGDKNLNHLLEKGNVDANSLGELVKEDYYSEDYIKKYYEDSLKKLEAFEKTHCDIKIADYVREHGRERVLFYSVTHPGFEVISEIARRIAQVLGTDEKEILNSNKNGRIHELNHHGEVVYPSVYKGLHIKEEHYKERKTQPGQYNVSYTFEEYISEYIKMGSTEKEEMGYGKMGVLER